MRESCLDNIYSYISWQRKQAKAERREKEEKDSI